MNLVQRLRVLGWKLSEAQRERSAQSCTTYNAYFSESLMRHIKEDVLFFKWANELPPEKRKEMPTYDMLVKQYTEEYCPRTMLFHWLTRENQLRYLLVRSVIDEELRKLDLQPYEVG